MSGDIFPNVSWSVWVSPSSPTCMIALVRNGVPLVLIAEPDWERLYKEVQLEIMAARREVAHLNDNDEMEDGIGTIYISGFHPPRPQTKKR